MAEKLPPEKDASASEQLKGSPLGLPHSVDPMILLSTCTCVSHSACVPSITTISALVRAADGEHDSFM